MNRMEQLFNQNKKKTKKYFIPFIMAGDPNLEVTKKYIYLLEESGCDMIEIGVPFSDPIADGPVIADAHYRGLCSQTTLESIFEVIKEVRENTQIPIILMLYSNLIISRGCEAFFEACRLCGVDGVIIPDVPMEEYHEFEEKAQENEVMNIRLVAPTSRERMIRIVEGAKGFLYCVSSMGVTGERAGFDSSLYDFLDEVRAVSNIPVAVGFGISHPEHLKSVLGHADGAIVGSAIVRRMEQEYQENRDVLKAYILEMKETINTFF
ncbi:MAG: tryptophan synthase subunit alpha [Cellulosilyticaceae bacterium]